MAIPANAYQIPLQPYAQSLTVTLNNTKYQLVTQYRNTVNGGWIMDINDQYGNSIIAGMALVTGVDLLQQYYSFGIGGGLFLVPDVGDAAPGYADLGVTCQLWFIPYA